MDPAVKDSTSHTNDLYLAGSGKALRVLQQGSATVRFLCLMTQVTCREETRGKDGESSTIPYVLEWHVAWTGTQ